MDQVPRLNIPRVPLIRMTALGLTPYATGEGRYTYAVPPRPLPGIPITEFEDLGKPPL